MIAAIPSIDPVDGAEVVGCFCYRTYPDVEFHKGVDLGAGYGETVRAAAAGTVVAAGWDSGGYGIKVDIDHGNGYHTWYAHLSHADVAIGQHVYKGQSIAEVGSTGFSTGPHLHYQVMLNGSAVDPTPFLHGVPSNVLASLP
jgi:murein DD-endopeptidase MepM/ murein hydrolase activator NlpD